MHSKLKRLGAIAGIAFPVLQMTAQGLIQVGGMEPSFTAPASEILQFFQNRDPALFDIGAYLSAISMIVFLWFVAVLWDQLRKAEGEAGWLSIIALGSGIVAASAFMESGGWPLAVFRVGEGLDPQIARTLFDAGNFNFANIWVSLGSMVLVAGIILRNSDTVPKWLGWASILLAVSLIFARIIWTTQIAFLPYILFWLWMIAIGIILLRRL
jgi:hypothetical protein